MKRSNLFLIIAGIVLVISCAKSDDILPKDMSAPYVRSVPSGGVQCDTIFILTCHPICAVTSKPYQFENVEILQDCLPFELRYSARCPFNGSVLKYQLPDYDTTGTVPIATIQLSFNYTENLLCGITTNQWEDNADLIWIKQDLQADYDSCFIFLDGVGLAPDTTLTYVF